MPDPLRLLLGPPVAVPETWRGSPPRPAEIVLPVRALDLALARFGQAVGAVALLIGIYVTSAVSTVTGGALSALALGAVVFYTTLHHTIRRDIGPPWLRWVAPAFEVAIPAAALWVLARTEGPAYAIGSWVPAQLSAGFVVASALRLDPRVPAAMGIASAAAYLAVWGVSIRPALAVGEGDLLLHDPSMQLARAGTLALNGVVTAVATVRLRRLLARGAGERSRFGDYELGADIASGAMGRVVDAVYRPDGGAFRRRVALKLLHPHLAVDPDHVERFRTEAELAGRLVHPNLVPVVDYGRVGESWYLAMDFVEGRTLQEVLGERRKLGRPLPARIVAWIGLQLAQGLDHAHARAKDERGAPLRVVHRDLSPSNVLLDRAGRVRITDFGVARALRDAPALHTRTLVGKASYVAPEVLRDHVVDEHADLWSLGVILWELLCNDRLFARDTEAATLLAVVEAPIPAPSAVRSGAAPHWDALLGRMLDRDRSARLPTAAAVVEALERVSAAEGQVLPQDVREMLAREDLLEELALDETSDEIPRSALPDILAALGEPGPASDGGARPGAEDEARPADGSKPPPPPPPPGAEPDGGTGSG